MSPQLQPKIRPRNSHPLLPHRLAAARNGWTQNPCTLKTQTCKRWNKLACDEAAIESLPEWRNLRWPGTAVRVVGELAVVDIDISDPDIAELVLDDLFELDPEAFNSAIIRGSGRASMALFFRWDQEPFSHRVTRKYTAHPDNLEAWLAAHAMPERDEEEHVARMEAIRTSRADLDVQFVEIYGGLAKARYFQYEGPHSEGRVYVLGERTPWNTAVSELPLLPMAPGPLIDRIDAILAGHLTLIPSPDEGGAETVYNLKPEYEFIHQDGTRESYASLEARLEPGAEHGVRGCMTPAGYAESKSHAHANCYVSTQGRLVVSDWSHDGRKHYYETEAPPQRPDEAAVREAIASLDGGNDNEPPHDNGNGGLPPQATPEGALLFLLENYAFDYHAGKVVRITATDIDTCFIDLDTFHNRYAAHRFPPATAIVQATNPGRRQPLAVSRVWLVDARRATVAGTRFRPDMTFPFFQEPGDELRTKNTYRRPRHRGTADLKPLFAFFEVFIPDPAQREWYLDVVAHRWVHPAIPGPSVVLVAHGAGDPMTPDYGTGRSTWFDFEKQLYGREYVRNEEFSIVTGQNRQADYTGWKAYRRLVTIDEADTSLESGTFKGGHSSYESLKTLADPSPRWRTFKVKYGKAFEDRDFAAMDVATNNQGGFHMAAGDRRFGVIHNGRALTMDEATALHACLKQEGCAAAFARWCEARDLSAFNPYKAPPVFAAKARMQGLSVSELDRVFEEMQQAFGKLFVKEQAKAFAKASMEERPSFHDTTFDKRFDAAFRLYCTPLRDAKMDVRVVAQSPYVAQRRPRVYCFDARQVVNFSKWVPASIHREMELTDAAIAACSVQTETEDEHGPDTGANVPGSGPRVIN